MIKLTANFSLEEMLISDTAVRKGIQEQFNPPQQVIDNLTALCENILQPLRNEVPNIIRITSGYRCEKVNKAIGGAKTSQHIEGKAADHTIEGMTVEQLFRYYYEHGYDVDQCIQEFDSWVHVSYNGGKNRNQFLRATKVNGKTVYTDVTKTLK